MKKKVILLLAVMLIAVMAFAGCSPDDKAYSRTVTSMDGLKTIMGPDMVYPNIELKSGEWFDSYKYKDTVSLPEGARNNEINLLYIPAISKAKAEELMSKEPAFDKDVYRYSIKVTLDNKYGEIFNKGTIELYVHGTNYNVEGLKGTDVKLIKVADRKAKLDKDNAKDAKKLGDKYVSTINDKGVFVYENSIDKEVKRYFTVGDQYGYELTACIRVNEEAFKSIKNKDEKAAAMDKALNELAGYSRTALDGFVENMLG